MEGVRERTTAGYVAMLQDLVLAARRDQILAASLKAHVEDEELSPFHAVLQRAVRRKRLAATAPVELVHDVAEAMVLRQLQTGAPFDRAFVARVVDEVLLPLLRRRRARRS
jgi:hypothetical protein